MWVYRVLVWAVLVVVLFVTRHVCLELQAGERVEREPKARRAGSRLGDGYSSGAATARISPPILSPQGISHHHW